MSLEAQIAELVAKTNSLINVFNSRKTEIDAAVAAAVSLAGSPTKQRNVYVDAVLGSDTSGDGSLAKPFKTVRRALSTVIPGSFVDVRLFADQDHVIDGGDAVLVNSFVRFYTHGSTTVRARLRNACFNPSWNALERNQCYGIINLNSLLIFNSVDIYTADFIDTTALQVPGGYNSIHNSLIRRHDGASGSNIFFRSNIVLGDTALVRNTSGGSTQNVSFWGLSVSRAGVNVPRIPLYETEGVPCSVNAWSVSIPSGAAWANDLITGIRRDTAGLPRNVISNLVL